MVATVNILPGSGDTGAAECDYNAFRWWPYSTIQHFLYLESSNLNCEVVPSAVDIILGVSGVLVFQEQYIFELLPSELGSVYGEGMNFHNSVLK